MNDVYALIRPHGGTMMFAAVQGCGRDMFTLQTDLVTAEHRHPLHDVTALDRS